MTSRFLAVLALSLIAPAARAQTGRVQVDTFPAVRAIDQRSADQVWNCQRMSSRLADRTDSCLEQRYAWEPKAAAAASDRLHLILARLDLVSTRMKTESEAGMLKDSLQAVGRAYQLLDSLRLAGPPAAFAFERALEESVNAYTEKLIGPRPTDVPDARSR